MKILKGLSIFFLFVVLFGSCFDPPEYSVVPQIEYNDIEYVEGSPFDTLILKINFKDGDGDLGLNTDVNSDNYDINPPYNSTFYFLEDGTGELTKVPTYLRYSNLPPSFIEPNSENQGKLVTIRTRNKPGYGSLPYPYSCKDYIYTSLYVSEENASLFDETYNIIDTLKSVSQPDVYVLKDTFYYELNPQHYNIDIDFLIRNTDGSGTYTEFDWNTLDCGTTFNGRFPVLTDKPRVVEGTLTYNMTSIGFLQLFSVKVMKLRIRVRDRALNESNVIETPDFTLNDIRR